MPSFQEQSHVKWDCTYHVIFVPKYRKKVLYEPLRKRIGEIIRDLARQKGVSVIEGTACPDHIHMVLSIPPKYSVASIMGFLKGKSAIRMHYEFSKTKRVIAQKSFWARGYFVRTIGIDQKIVEEYVRNQLEQDKREDNNPPLDLTWN